MHPSVEGKVDGSSPSGDAGYIVPMVEHPISTGEAGSSILSVSMFE